MTTRNQHLWKKGESVMLSHEKAEQSERERAQRDALRDVDDAVAELSKPWGAVARDGRTVSTSTQSDAIAVREEQIRTEKLEDQVAELQAEREALWQKMERLQAKADSQAELAARWRETADDWRYRYFQIVVVLAEMAQDYEL
jgi:chromosome segregation ATPase